MAIQITPMMIRGLKGAPISCLVTFIVMRQVMNLQALVRTTGYSDKSIADALMVLSDFGLVTRNGRYGWQLADGVAQLPLTVLTGEEESQPDSVIEPADQMTIELSPVEEVSTIDEIEPVTEKSTENFRIPSLASRSLTSVEQELDLLLDSRADPENLRVNEVYAALEVAGIRDPARSRLAKLPHVTGKLVRYHVQTAQGLGLAIYRIEHNFRMRDDWADSEAPDRFATRPLVDNVPAIDDLPAEETVQVSETELEAWERALDTIQPAFRAVDFSTWVAPIELHRVEGAKWVAKTCNHFARDWVREHAVDQLQAALAGLAGTAIILTVE